MTGWAQINGLRGDTSILERTKYDLWYVENWSLWLDIRIIIRTVFDAILSQIEFTDSFIDPDEFIAHQVQRLRVLVDERL